MGLNSEVVTNIGSNTPEVKSLPEPGIKAFLGAIAPLQLSPTDLIGDVAVIGHGVVFGERSLLCVDGNYKQLRDEINSLTLVDDVTPADPEYFFNDSDYPYRSMHKIPGQPPETTSGSINYYPWRVQPALGSQALSIFNTVTFFRIDDLQRQFPAMVLLAHQNLKQGGLFMGSGSFDGVVTMWGISRNLFSMVRAVELSNPDFSGMPYPGKHIGFVLRRR